ncbi:MAG: VCBS repeat-containing protein [Opitutaceae bacterium]|nr:VCBS repeat-containing protein [Opitutaceae bacterium]
MSTGSARAAPLKFTEHLIAGGFSYPYGINVGDIAGNGHCDITLADARKTNAVFWFENDGAGKFTRHLIYHQPLPAWRLERHVIADMNGDGHLDIVIVENSLGNLLWLENPGPQHVRGLWKPHFITLADRVPGAYDVAVGDIDGDGLPDVVASSWRRGNMFSWHKNPGRPSAPGADYMTGTPSDFNWAEWKQHNIAEDLLETRTVRLADMNGDGRLDVVGTATRSGLVLWLENPGKPTSGPWVRHMIDQTGRPAHGQVVDMNGDGKPDVVMASGMSIARDLFESGVQPVVHEVAWYENLGDGAAWKKHIIHRPFPQAFEAVAADLNGDGRMEVVATAWLEGPGVALAWFEKTGDEAWVMHPLKENWPHAVQVIVADLDGDSRPDILACAEDGSGELRWWRNDGPG